MTRTMGAVGAAMILASVAQAQDADYAAKMREVNASVPAPDRRAIAADALATLQAMAKAKGRCVPTGVAMEKPTPATADRMVIQSVQSGTLKNGWLAYGKPIGCGAARATRFIVLLLSDGGVRARVVNQGESITSPSLMRDTTTNAALVAWNAVRAVDPTCGGDDLEMVRSTVSARSADLAPDFYGARYRGDWEEAWTFSVCGRSAEVPVSFTTDGTGGAYTNVNSKVVKLAAP